MFYYLFIHGEVMQPMYSALTALSGIFRKFGQWEAAASFFNADHI